MTRHTAVATPSSNLWANIENAFHGALRIFAGDAAFAASLAAHEHEQSLVRRSGRQWLLG